MKKDGKYRFSLQFSSDTPENMQIGELLERLGNKKSRVIISALTEYLQKHPQLSEESCKIEIRATGYDWEKVEEFIRKLIDEKLSSAHISNEIGTGSEKIDKESLEEDVAKMLENINLF